MRRVVFGGRAESSTVVLDAPPTGDYAVVLVGQIDLVTADGTRTTPRAGTAWCSSAPGTPGTGALSPLFVAVGA
ncbi:hypothetical protein [Pseudonocardia sp. NPDC049154]|uniref:hypothetical protein n=1 Tax=Pseudonocardia sp. NPDC049154 TaxID=3155501 RepID=UPI0033E3CF77